MSARDFALMIALVTVAGFAFVPIKLALREIPPFMLAALRFFFAAFPALLFVRPPAFRWRDIAAYGIAIGLLQFGLLFFAIQIGMPAGLSSLVIQVQVFFTIGLAVLLSGDRMTRANVLGAAIAVVGMVVLGAYKFIEGLTGSLVGFLLVIVAGFFWAVGNMIIKRAGAGRDVSMFGMVVWSSLFPVLPLLAVSWMFEGGPAAWVAAAHASWFAWGCVLFLASAATLFAWGAWNYLLRRYATALVSPFALLIPITGLGSGALFIGEYLAPMQWLGVVLVLAGLVVNVYGGRR
ncbi:MAG: EamA family transporter [Proteobacteria bacterium]|nr:EamA family transporter [Pseudomonadota bacterium]